MCRSGTSGEGNDQCLLAEEKRMQRKKNQSTNFSKARKSLKGERWGCMFGVARCKSPTTYSISLQIDVSEQMLKGLTEVRFSRTPPTPAPPRASAWVSLTWAKETLTASLPWFPGRNLHTVCSLATWLKQCKETIMCSILKHKLPVIERKGTQVPILIMSNTWV